MPTTNDILAEAMRLHQQGKLAEAEALYQDLLTDDPSNAECWHLLGILHAQQNHFEAACDCIEKAIRLKPNRAHYHNNLANVLKHLGDDVQAIEHFRQAISLAPASAEAYNNLANLYYRQDELDAAMRYYAKAVHLMPNHVEAHFNLGILFVKQYKIPEAIKQFNNVLSLQPENVLALKKLADLYLQQNRLSEAQRYYEKCLRLVPDDVNSLNNLGVIYLKTHAYEKAIQYFIKVLAIDEQHIDARNNLAAMYLKQDRYEVAARHYQALLALKPDDMEAHYNFAVAQMAIGHLSDAMEHFQTVIDNHLDNVDALCNLAAVYLKLGRREDAIKNYMQAKHYKPDDAVINYMLAALQKGAIPEHAPTDYVKNLFDNYAGYYEKHVAEALHYRVPELMRQAISDSHQLKQLNYNDLRMLDLGCGSGLSGQFFADKTKQLVGVDLSEKMISLARSRQIYQELVVDDIQHYLKHCQQQFDLIIAADVFVYAGDLAMIFKECHRVLAEQGIFCFSLEAMSKEEEECHPYVLRGTARFAHSKEYIKSLSAKFGFTIIYCDDIVPRYQDERPLAGYLYLLTKQ